MHVLPFPPAPANPNPPLPHYPPCVGQTLAVLEDEIDHERAWLDGNPEAAVMQRRLIGLKVLALETAHQALRTYLLRNGEGR